MTHPFDKPVGHSCRISQALAPQSFSQGMQLARQHVRFGCASVEESRRRGRQSSGELGEVRLEEKAMQTRDVVDSKLCLATENLALKLLSSHGLVHDHHRFQSLSPVSDMPSEVAAAPTGCNVLGRASVASRSLGARKVPPPADDEGSIGFKRRDETRRDETRRDETRRDETRGNDRRGAERRQGR
eukprot:scaffold21709_cov29-Tisochrysis_lutea.AAC.1